MPRIQAIAPGCEVVLVVIFFLQCGQVQVMGEGPNTGRVIGTTWLGFVPAAVAGATGIINSPAFPAKGCKFQIIF